MEQRNLIGARRNERGWQTIGRFPQKSLKRSRNRRDAQRAVPERNRVPDLPDAVEFERVSSQLATTLRLPLRHSEWGRGWGEVAPSTPNAFPMSKKLHSAFDFPAQGRLAFVLSDPEGFCLAGVRSQIGPAYLLARTTDTIADTDLVPVADRLRSLQALRERILGKHQSHLEFGELARQQGAPAERAARTLRGSVDDPVAADRCRSTRDSARSLETITSGQGIGLDTFLLRRYARTECRRWSSADELDDYTYRVAAGCVGEFWTRMCRAHLFPRGKSVRPVPAGKRRSLWERPAIGQRAAGPARRFAPGALLSAARRFIRREFDAAGIVKPG